MIIVPISSFPFPTKTTRIYPADALCGFWCRLHATAEARSADHVRSSLQCHCIAKGVEGALAPQIIQVMNDQFSIETHRDDWGSHILRNPHMGLWEYIYSYEDYTQTYNYQFSTWYPEISRNQCPMI
jgi:hypothetical protein